MKIFKKILKILGILFFLAFVVLYIMFYRASAPEKDKNILAVFEDTSYKATLSYIDFDGRKVRTLNTRKHIDTTLPNIVFVHGSIGSCLDFQRYMIDPEINKKANLISYDRIGYGPKQKGKVLNSIQKETALLDAVVQYYNLDLSKTTIVGYSFGGPVALNYAYEKNVANTVLCAPALFGDYEVTPWMIWSYKLWATRFLVPDIWKSASKEKIAHADELRRFEKRWSKVSSNITAIHGDADWLVPYNNSLELQKAVPEDHFKLVTLPEASHGLIWGEFNTIKKEFLKVL